MQPFNITDHTTSAHLWMISAARSMRAQGVGDSVASTALESCGSLLKRGVFNHFLGGCRYSRLALSVGCHLTEPCRRRRGGQERTPILLLFLRHHASELGMQVCRLFLRLAPERDEGTIEIHRCEGEQSKQSFLFDQRENVRHPRIRAQVGLGQNEIQPS